VVSIFKTLTGFSDTQNVKMNTPDAFIVKWKNGSFELPPRDTLHIFASNRLRFPLLLENKYNVPHNNTRFDLVATVYDQVYKGISYRYPLANSAVNKTYGEIITYRGEPIEAKYSSTCGGRTSAASDNWGKETDVKKIY